MDNRENFTVADKNTIHTPSRVSELFARVHRWHVATLVSVAGVIFVSLFAYHVVTNKEYTAVQADLTSSKLNINATMSTAGQGEWKSEPLSDGTFGYTLRQSSTQTQKAMSATNTSDESTSASQSLSVNQTAITSPEYRFKVTAKPVDSAAVPANFSLIFDYLDAANYSYVNYSAKAGVGLGGIYQVKAGVVRELGLFQKYVVAGKTYKAEIRKDEDSVRAYLDGSYLARVEYVSTTAAKVGLGSLGGNVDFTNLEVKVSGTSTPLPSAPVNSTPAPTPPVVGTNPTPVTPAPPVITDPASPVSGGRVIAVATSAQLTAAMSSVKAGDVIKMSDGVYAAKISIGKGAAAFASTISGTEKAPITIQGSRNAVIEGGGVSGTYGLYLYGANYWNISGITVRNASKGIVLDGSSHTTINGIKVTTIGEEGVHFRSFSSDNLITNSEVTLTGQRKPQYGEGVYIGSATSNWGTYSNGKPDNSDRNRVIGNTISYTGAESIDIKEGSTGGIIANNRFDGTNMIGENFADSWLDVKGNNYTVTGNSGTNSILDGIQVHTVVSGWGNNNVFKSNSVNVNGPGVGFNIQSKSVGTVVYCDNTVSGAEGGFGNITCRK